MVKFRFLFHGTSSFHKPSIQKNGLSPRNGTVYLTTHPRIALLEAERTVKGEANLREGYKRGVGGSPIIVVVDRSAAVKLKLDIPGYYERPAAVGYRLSEVRLAFATSEGVSPASVSFIENNILAECQTLLAEIELMTSTTTFGFTLNFDLVPGLALRC
jgi:hypothetical protein